MGAGFRPVCNPRDAITQGVMIMLPARGATDSERSPRIPPRPGWHPRSSSVDIRLGHDPRDIRELDRASVQDPTLPRDILRDVLGQMMAQH